MDTLRKMPAYKNVSGRYARITLYPGAARVCEWKTLDLDPELGNYAVTITRDHRLVLLPGKDRPMEYLDHTGVVMITRADIQSDLFSLVFERGLLIKGPSPSHDA